MRALLLVCGLAVLAYVTAYSPPSCRFAGARSFRRWASTQEEAMLNGGDEAMAQISLETAQTEAATKTSSLVATARSFTTSGAAMEMNSVCLSVGNADLISDINWTIMPLERWALVGQNGAGKSTLLRALTGTGGELVSLRDGNIAVGKKSRFGYLEQKGVSGSTASVRVEVSSRMDRLAAATKALETIEKKVTEGDTSEEALVELEEATIEFEQAGGYTVEQKIAGVLRGLGFVDGDYDRLCSEFSGGWQMRIALARLLLSEPDLLILDEPTNHLDKGARDWLGSYLSRYAGTLLLVSHDVGILESAVTSIAEVRAGKIELYKSRTHAQWQVEREERVRDALAKYEANQREIARLQTYIDRFGAKTMGAAGAQSRRKDIEKLEKEMQAPITSEGPLPFLKLPPPPRGTKLLLKMTNTNLGWPTGKQTGNIISDCSLTIERGMRIVVRGPNGAGKSTLLSALSGKLKPSSGTREEGDGLELGVFTQDLAQDLDQEAIATDVVTQKARAFDATISDQDARGALGALGLRGEKALRKVGHLSGGEKARVALASFVLMPHNLLLLDEPSNHLDHQTLTVLTSALRKFEGATLVISHDREFLEKLEPTHVLTVRGGRATLEERGLREADFNDPLDSRAEEKFEKAAPADLPTAQSISIKNSINSNTKHKAPGVAAAPVLSDEERKKRLNAPRRIPKIENSISKHNADIAKIDEDMMANGKDRGKLMDLQKKKDDISIKIGKLEEELLDLMQYV